MSYTHPFDSSIKVSIQVTRKYFDKHPEKYEGFVYDPERGCDFNEHVQLLVDEDGTYLLIREAKD